MIKWISFCALLIVVLAGEVYAEQWSPPNTPDRKADSIVWSIVDSGLPTEQLFIISGQRPWANTKWDSPPGYISVDYIRFEVYESDPAKRNTLKVLFTYCNTLFRYGPPAIGNSAQPPYATSVKVESIIIDNSGKPIGDKARYLLWSRGDKEDSWQENSAIQELDLKNFYFDLPQWAKDELWILTGFLSSNTSHRPLSKFDEGASLIDVLAFLPIANTKWLGFVEAAIKMIIIKGIRNYEKSKNGYYAAYHIVNYDQTEYPELPSKYREDGKNVWDQLYGFQPQPLKNLKIVGRTDG